VEGGVSRLPVSLQVIVKIAAIANAGASHQMTMCAIGRELQKRGHHFTLLGTEYQARQHKLADIPFARVGGGRRDPVQHYYERAKQEGDVSISATIEYMTGMGVLLCEEMPAFLKQQGIDFVLADQEEPGGAAAAELAGLPYASICSSLPLNEASDIPPGFLGWRYSTGVWAQVRNRFGYAVRNLAVARVNEAINVYRLRAGLPPYRKPDDSFSKQVQITQLVRDFDFPRAEELPALQYVGPFQREDLSNVDFPFERLDGRPLLYASFGTTFGNRTGELRAVAEACAALSVQLVISLGGAEPGMEHAAFPGSPIVVRYAPQRELLSRAALVITHAGLNTTLEALSLGVPLLALPIAGDQLGVAARIRYHRVGVMLGRKQRSVGELRSAISTLLEEARWRDAAKRLQEAIGRSGGAGAAAELILGTGR
jgi:zeaxanthin glucosyltransferase